MIKLTLTKAKVYFIMKMVGHPISITMQTSDPFSMSDPLYQSTSKQLQIAIS